MEKLKEYLKGKLPNSQFTVYDDYTVLQLLWKLIIPAMNCIIDDMKNLYFEISQLLTKKTDLYGDHKGSWQGINKPTLSDEGMRGTVELLQKIINKAILNYTNLKGDGLTDETDEFISIINKAKLFGLKKLSFPQGKYKITRPLDFGEMVVDFNNSEIISYAKANGNVSSEYGLFNFHGNTSDNKILDFIRRKERPSESATLLEVVNNNDVRKSGTNVGIKIKTDNNLIFNVGDTLYIHCLTRLSAPYDKSKFEPEIRTTSKIINKDNEYIYLDYSTPFNFTKQPTNTSIVFKVNTLKNVGIKNVFVKDMINVSNGLSPSSQELLEGNSIISTILCENVDISNVEIEGHRGNALNIFANRNVSVKNINAKNAKMWEGGKGYLMQVLGSRYVTVENILGIKCRHVVDFSYSSHGLIRNVKAMEGYSSDLDLHGLCEHDITFDNCEGYLALGNSIDMFTCIMANIEIKNSTITLPSKTGSITGDYFADNVVIKDSKIYIDGFFEFINCVIDNCIIDWKFSLNKRDINTRDLNIPTSCIIKNSTINLQAFENNTQGYFNDYTYLTIDNVNIISFQANNGIVFDVMDIQYFKLKDSRFNRLMFRCRSLGKYPIVKHEFTGNTLYCSANESFFVKCHGVKECQKEINISNNFIRHTGQPTNILNYMTFIMSVSDGSYLNGFVRAFMNDNKFIGNDKIIMHFSYADSYNEGTTIKMFDFDNFVKCYATGASAKWTPTRNFLEV